LDLTGEVARTVAFEFFSELGELFFVRHFGPSAGGCRENKGRNDN
jgi:hypothetical protein